MVIAHRWRRFLLVTLGGELLFLFLVPPEVRPAGRRLFVLTWPMVAAWLAEILPLGITALMFPVVGTLAGLTSARDAFAPFAHPIIFLFLGSFLMARAIEKTGTAEWIVQSALRRPGLAASPYRFTLVLGFVVFGLSMWLSNTATVASILPMIPAMIAVVPEGSRRHMKKMILLLVAYAANIGGIATPVGTPPNLIALGMVDRMVANRHMLNFLEWVSIALPPALIMFVTVHFVLYRRYLRHLPHSTTASLFQPVPLSPGGRRALRAFLVLIILWFGPGLIRVSFPNAPLSKWLAAHWPEAIPAVLMGVSLFLIPGDDERPLLTLSDLNQIDWNTLLLFGGGLSFGMMARSTGLLEDLIEGWIRPLHPSPQLLLVMLVVTAVFATELFSNTAMANLLIPVAIGLASALHRNPWPPVLGVAFGCSMAFMLPVATPPNAMVFGAGGLTLRDMTSAGWRANLISIIVISMTVLVLQWVVSG